MWKIWGVICPRIPPRLFPAEPSEWIPLPGNMHWRTDFCYRVPPGLFPLRTQCAHCAATRQIVDYANLVLLFWDGSSHGTRHVLNLCRSLSKPHRLFSPAKLGQVKSE